MEDGLGAHTAGDTCGGHPYVLILVLVEDGLGEKVRSYMRIGVLVLILVLVEDGLGGSTTALHSRAKGARLNPCFSGGWSRRIETAIRTFANTNRLNPCFSGGWSRSGDTFKVTTAVAAVLILVLVEDGLGAGL